MNPLFPVLLHKVNGDFPMKNMVFLLAFNIFSLIFAL